MSNPFRQSLYILSSLALLLGFQTGVHADTLKRLMPADQLETLEHHTNQEIAHRFREWHQLLAKREQMSDLDKLQAINAFYNRMTWEDDLALWKQRDYWATPAETLIRNAGDCEDFSIAKYFSLLEMGISENQLKVAYVRLRDGTGHMVLEYYPQPDADPLVLDNIEAALLPLSQRKDLLPRFRFDQHAVWWANRPDQPASTASAFNRWADLIQRMNLEAF